MHVTESISPAWERTKAILLPFQAKTWFSLGLIFALQSCIEGGGANMLRLPDLGDRRHGGGSGHGWTDALTGAIPAGFGLGMAELLVIGAIAIVLAVPLFLGICWLGSRGRMMAIRAVATGSDDVGEGWRATERAGGRMFTLQLAMTGIALAVFLPLIGLGVAVWSMRQASGLVLLVPIVLVALLAALPLAIAGSLARNFVAPLMLKHDLGARAAWGMFWPAARGHLGSLVLFWLLAGAFGILGALAAVVGGFLTCCLGFLPVLHQTLLAPYYVFERAWSLEVLASLGPEFDLRAPVPHGQHPPYGGPPYGGPPYGGPPYGGPPYGGPPYGGPPGGGYSPPPGGAPPAGGFGAP